MRSKASSQANDAVEASTLYVVATPIGNLGDLTRRAEQVLGGVDSILAEDTRRTRRLLSHLGISKRLQAHHDHNERRTVPRLVERLQDGAALALVSDAGTPAVADPGYRLVRAAIDAGVAVVPVPGASAVLAALVGSGLPTDRFTFAGYPPRKQGERLRFMGSLVNAPGTLVLLESPHRIAATLAAAAEVFGNRRAALAREITKLHEEFRRGRLAELHATLEEDIRGEITLCIEAAETPVPPVPSAARLRRRYNAKLADGIERGAAVRELARESGLHRRDVYGALHLQASESTDEETASSRTDEAPDSGAAE